MESAPSRSWSSHLLQMAAPAGSIFTHRGFLLWHHSCFEKLPCSVEPGALAAALATCPGLPGLECPPRAGSSPAQGQHSLGRTHGQCQRKPTGRATGRHVSSLWYLEGFRKGLGIAPNMGLDMVFIKH